MPYALITGATGGLGQALSHKLSASGWALALASRDPVPTAIAGNTEVEAIETDVATAEGARAALAASMTRFGHPPDGLAHCAGDTLITALHRTQDDQYRDCISANLDSAFFMLRAYVEALLDAKQTGSAVLVSSVVARIGVSNHEAIAAAKGGIEALARSTAASYAARGIRVNVVAPGLMRSPLTERLFANERAEAQIAAQYPLGRYGQSEDTAGAMAWLLSDEARWITGQVIAVDGGFSTVRPTVRTRP
jgi:NAD(P)-dependent dehydrogenase (short-subunit alcohol dehydrogenase family)